MAFLLDDRARVVFDTDAGVDDGVALLMALHGFPPDAMVGITTVFGNVDLHQANHNMKQYVHRSRYLSPQGASN
jgi:purine nucleosidase